MGIHRDNRPVECEKYNKGVFVKIFVKFRGIPKC